MLSCTFLRGNEKIKLTDFKKTSFPFLEACPLANITRVANKSAYNFGLPIKKPQSEALASNTSGFSPINQKLSLMKFDSFSAFCSTSCFFKRSRI
ncbi:hypothetical protein AA976_07860 [Helicobacter pylori]|nr:hypothetical protein AA976_07860 [Helicobacter pylori]